MPNTTRSPHSGSQPPPWWQAWETLAPRWLMAAEGRLPIDLKVYDFLERMRFDTNRLRLWQPSERDGRRLQNALSIVALALREQPPNFPERKLHLDQQLAGTGHWEDVRRLAKTYLDGKHKNTPFRSASVKQLPTSSSAHQKRLWPNQIRKQENRHLLNDLAKRAPLFPAQISIADYFSGASELTLYLDEAWHGLETNLQSNDGVIAGVLCRGCPNQSFKELPGLDTHVYRQPLQAQQALVRLWSCLYCLPLIFHLRLSTGEIAGPNSYDLLLQHAVRFLLGWLLPKPKTPIRLHIYPEAIAPPHPQGDTATAFYRGLLSADANGRFANWRLEALRWEEKNFGYIPYADLLAHLTLEHTEVNRALGAWSNFKQLPGYVPFSLELVPRLERLEHVETAANLDDVIDFALETGASPFGRVVLRDLAQRLAARPDLQQRLLETLEARYRDKVRELKHLRRAFAAVRRLLPALPDTASPRMRLLWYLLALQDANHDGDPERIRATAGEYLQERERLKQSDRELCADADLNLAVHYADRFAFGHAEITIGDWIDDPLFPALSLRQRGRFYSALGQYRAMQGDTAGADELFRKALQDLGEAPMTAAERADECEQTHIYRAINAIDGSLHEAPKALEALFGPITPALAAQFAADGSVKTQYRHHLLLRALTLRPELEEARLAYLAARAHWQSGHTQHPWPSIHGHRGFLLWNWEDGLDETWTDASLAAFNQAIELAALSPHGPTIKLIGAFWATVATCCFDNCGYQEHARTLLDQARVLASAGPHIETLEEVLAAPAAERIGEVFSALPFNYR